MERSVIQDGTSDFRKLSTRALRLPSISLRCIEATGFVVLSFVIPGRAEREPGIHNH